ncbi:Transcription factor AP-4 (activating enhancer binding protein 4) [Halocaridina rubra]|uniref:Transcription factor AP-4 (Activating enhancer binding protein 4) n=1 Tax=Halocaridina rubra TaxID=373956 RepID=A0AAN9AHN3_HALRR
MKMTMFPRVGEKRRIDDIKIEDEEAIGSLCRLSGRPISPKTAMEQEKRIRREIANSNERRRMQSINAGFASLKTILPHHEGEKLSKAAILQQTAEYIYTLEQEKTRLLSQNCQLKRLVNQQQHHADAEGSHAGGDNICDEGVTTVGESVVNTQVDSNPAMEDLRREMIDLRVQLDRERRHRMSLEERIRTQEAQAFPERIKDLSLKTEEHVVKEMGSGSVSSEPSGTVTLANPVENPLRQASAQVIKIEKEMKSESPHHSPPRLHAALTMPSSVSTPSITTPAVVTTSNPTARQPVTATIGRQTIGHSQHNNPLTGTIVSATPAATIVTVVPSSKGGVDALPSVFEALTASGRFGAKVEVEPAPRVPSPEATIEYVDDNKSRTVYIVNSTNAACQKSLDTICEAIRHLEGDHMFQSEEHHPRIEEEIITEETLTIEDHTGQHVSFSGSQVPVALGGQVTLAGAEEPITLHMVGEPQEVPLELTTHRPSSQSCLSNVHPSHHSTISLTARPSSHHSPSHTAAKKEDSLPVCSITTTTSSHSSSSSQSLLQATRPGVIVVKHP